jgi:hypothetical protein
LLNQKKVQKVLSLLKQGYSRYKTAAFAGVSKPTVSRIAAGKHRLLSNSVSGNDSCTVCLDLRGEHYVRYLRIRRKVEREILSGKREPLSALSGDFARKT